MPKAALFDQGGTRQGELDLPTAVFGITPHEPVVHEVLRWQLAGRHLGTHATKTRGDVRGGGRKPWRQKGTGRARAGSRRSPLWTGGGITFGPQPRSRALSLPKKVRRLAIRSLLSDRAGSGALTVIEDLPMERPRTKELAGLLGRLGLAGQKVVIVTGSHRPAAIKAADNLAGVRVLTARTVNVHDLLAHGHVVVTRDALPVLEEVWGHAG